ncbi:hypothetical protein CAPTEDRAFT_190846 [Capitella teleta]|uniref:Apple domain-containing protein n=1 Tax=Capitella teleta TaxID=283909 RepID=R7TYC5_CAPTE|nr:hypothetical protein CAPTEDRAFT_190846 [Capitella teleta]|eukprot:ELT98632.1 hypothetical protein CAPTEDRAFT_190846 [Capitella teleta]
MFRLSAIICLIHTGVSVMAIFNATHNCYWEERTNHTLINTDLMSSSTKSLEDCKLECLSQAECLSIAIKSGNCLMYDKGRYSSRLYTSLDTIFFELVCPDDASYSPNRDCEFPYERMHATVWGNNILELFYLDIAECKEACRRLYQCKSIDYQTDKSECRMNNVDHNDVGLTGVAYGLYIQAVCTVSTTEAPTKVSELDTTLTTVAVKALPLKVKNLQLKVKALPLEVKNLQLKVKALPLKVKNLQLKVKALPLEVKYQQLRVKNRQLKVKALSFKV